MPAVSPRPPNHPHAVVGDCGFFPPPARIQRECLSLLVAEIKGSAPPPFFSCVRCIWISGILVTGFLDGRGCWRLRSFFFRLRGRSAFFFFLFFFLFFFFFFFFFFWFFYFFPSQEARISPSPLRRIPPTKNVPFPFVKFPGVLGCPLSPWKGVRWD